MSRKVGKFWGLAVLLFAAVVTMVQLTGCGGGGSTTVTGTLRVGLTDAQSDSFEKVVITVKEVRVVPAGLEGADDNDPRLPVITIADPQPVNILDLRFVQETLGDIVLPTGTYNQIRLVLVPNSNTVLSNYVVLKSDPQTKLPIDMAELKTPSGTESGVKVKGYVEVKPGIINAIAVDFDPNTAIVVNKQKYILKPTGIRIVKLDAPLPEFGIPTNYGSLSGSVVSIQRNWSTATVSVVPQGSSTSIASGNIFSNVTGARWAAPFSAFVPEGSYRVHVRAAGFAPYSSPVTTVVKQTDKSLGEILLQLIQ